MSPKLKQLFKTLKAERLTDTEHDAIRADFISYMRAHPYEKRRKENPFLTLACFLFKKPAAITLCLALLIFGASSVAYASGSALPGDALYPIKVNITEEIKAAFLPKEEKARFEVERTARRIKEATALALNGRLTPETAREVQTHIEEHTEKISELTESISAQGDTRIAADIHTELQATLAANEQMFVAVVEETGITTPETQTLVAIIETAEDASKTETTGAVIALVQSDEMQEDELQEIAQEAKVAAEAKIAAVEQSVEMEPRESRIAQKLAATQTIKKEGERSLKEGAVREAEALDQPQAVRFQPSAPPPAPPSAPEPQPSAVSSEETEKLTPIIEAPLPRANTGPKIIAYPPPQKDAAAGSEISFMWEAFDPDNDDLRWQIWWGDRSGREFQAICESSACTRARASHIWEKSGSYTVRVRVSDGRGGSDSYSFAVTVQR